MEPKRKCIICDGDPARLSEIDSLLKESEPFKSIATITGASVGTIFRHSKHANEAKSSPGGQESPAGTLYAKISKLLDKLTRKGKLGESVKAIAELRKLEKTMQAQKAATVPVASTKSPWCNSLARILGYTPRALTQELVRDMKMWLKREANAPVALQACAAFWIAACDDEQDRPELADKLGPIIEKFLLEMQPYLERVRNVVQTEEEVEYSAVDLFGPET